MAEHDNYEDIDRFLFICCRARVETRSTTPRDIGEIASNGHELAVELAMARDRGIVHDQFVETHPSFEDVPLGPDTLRHNAYVLGWDHGAIDHTPPGACIPREPYRRLYYEGFAAGRMARGGAFAEARRLKDPEEGP